MLAFTYLRRNTRVHKPQISTAILVLAVALTSALTLSPARATPGSDTPAYRLVRTILLPGAAAEGADAGSLACDPEAHRVYVSRGTGVDVIDTGTGQVVGTVGGLSGSRGIALDPHDGRGFVSSGDADTVVMFDLATLRASQTIPVAAGPDTLIYESHSQRVIVFSAKARVETDIDANSGKIFYAFPLPGTPGSAVPDFRNGLVYDAYIDRSAVAELDPRLHSTGDVYPIAPGVRPTGLAIDNKNERLFCACANSTLIVMDVGMSLETGTILSSVPIGAGAGDCGFDPGMNRLYAASGTSSTVTVITRLRGTDDQYAAAATITTLPGARALTVDTKTHHFFVAGLSEGKLVVQEYAPV